MQSKYLPRQRSKKNTMTTTQKATEKLRDNLVKRCLDAGLGFRLISSGQASSLKVFSIKVDRESPGDKVVESGGIRIYLDPVSAAAVEKYELDYLDEPSGGFCLKIREAEVVTTFPPK